MLQSTGFQRAGHNLGTEHQMTGILFVGGSQTYLIMESGNDASSLHARSWCLASPEASSFDGPWGSNTPAKSHCTALTGERPHGTYFPWAPEPAVHTPHRLPQAPQWSVPPKDQDCSETQHCQGSTSPHYVRDQACRRISSRTKTRELLITLPEIIPPTRRPPAQASSPATPIPARGGEGAMCTIFPSRYTRGLTAKSPLWPWWVAFISAGSSGPGCPGRVWAPGKPASQPHGREPGTHRQASAGD